MNPKISLDELEAKVNRIDASPNYKPQITSNEAAKIAKVSLRTLRRWERAGITPERSDSRLYIRRYDQAEFEAFVKSRQETKLNNYASPNTDEEMRLWLERMGGDYKGPLRYV